MINWRRVQDLKEEVGEDDFNDIVILFLKEVEGVLQRLSVTSDHETLRADLHFLKGSAANLGFQSLVEFCEKGEGSADSVKAGSMEISNIVGIYAASKKEFMTKVGPPASPD